MKYLVTFLLISTFAFGQLFDTKQRWILPTNEIAKREIYLTPYDSSKIALNTMILKFLPKGKIEVDYQSSVEACAGVDFLDLDLDRSAWMYKNGIFTLKITGGYAAIDDFNFKRDYKIVIDQSQDVYLKKIKTYYFQKKKRDDLFLDERLEEND